MVADGGGGVSGRSKNVSGVTLSSSGANLTRRQVACVALPHLDTLVQGPPDCAAVLGENISNVMHSSVDDEVDILADLLELVVTVQTQICGCARKLSERRLQIFVRATGDEKLKLRETARLVVLLEVEVFNLVDQFPSAIFIAFIKSIEDANDFSGVRGSDTLKQYSPELREVLG
jgi:hypothetical protein